MEKKKGCNIRDVADRANVSTSTVSRALSGSKKISQKTTARVQKVAEELGYTPNSAAQALAKSNTNTLAVIVPYRSESEDPFSNAYFIKVISALSQTAKKRGYYLIYSLSNTVDDELRNIEELVMQKRVDGIILLGAREKDANVAYLLHQHMPFVVIGRPLDKKKHYPWVDNDNEGAMQSVVEHLIDKGHTRIAFLGGDSGLIVTQDRLRGYRSALASIDRSPHVVLDLPFSVEGGKRGFSNLMEGREDALDAIVTTDDLLAVGAYQSSQELGMDALQIVGFNNTFVGDLLHLPIDSVEIHAERLGDTAVQLLLQYLKDDIVGNEWIDTEIVLSKR